MSYSLKHLQYLVAVAEEKSFSKAALRCHVTQSTLSLGVQELERQMDLTLFERSRKNIIPTAAGRKAIQHAVTILSNSASMINDMNSLSNPGAGPLRIGAIPTIAPFYLPTILPKFEERFPDSDIQISEDTTKLIIQKVSDGHMDVGILALPIETGDLETRTLFNEDFMLAAPKTAVFPKHITLETLDEFEILLLREGHCLKDHILNACKLPPEKQNRFFEAESLHTLLAMVNQGYGVTLLPEMAVSSDIIKPYPNVNLHKFDATAPSRSIGLVWRKTDVRAKRYLTLDF